MDWRYPQRAAASELFHSAAGQMDNDPPYLDEDLHSMARRARTETEEIDNRDNGEFAKLLGRSPKGFFEARQRFLTWRRRDPYPDIQAGLLSCNDFCDYIVETGMLYPFSMKQQDIQRASCDFHLLGQIVYWDQQGDRREIALRAEEEFRLPKNAIAFVTLEPYLQIPDYIALRFNLKIRNVYRGLLLGTGPLIDPGYQGKLSIPLHNLTNNDYVLRGGEPLIVVEFTKLAIEYPDNSDEHTRFVHGPKSRTRLYRPFPEPQRPHFLQTERNVLYQLNRAEPQRAVSSSLPQTVEQLQSAADSAKRSASWQLIIAVATALLGLGALAATMWDIYSHTERAQARLDQRQTQLQSQLDSIRKSLK